MIIEKKVNIGTLNRERIIRIFLPIDYQKTEKNYPVIYMHDGQNLMLNDQSFGGNSWGIDKFVSNDNNKKAIIVGIDNGEGYRYNEYSPVRGSDEAEKLSYVTSYENFGGEGEAYLNWLVNELKPMIDSEFRTLKSKENTSLVGSSMGAYITLFASIYYPDVFGQIGLLSPAFWFNKEIIFNEVIQKGLPQDVNIYMSVGTAENNDTYLPYANEMAEILKDHHLNYIVIDNGEHNEATWEKQVPQLLNELIKGE